MGRHCCVPTKQASDSRSRIPVLSETITNADEYGPSLTPWAAIHHFFPSESLRPFDNELAMLIPFSYLATAA
jgi:hypothetical protein